MVDKIWYDWQHANPANFWSFDGGAVAVLNNSVPVPAFPNGGPPYVTVSSLLINAHSVNELTKPFTVRDPDPDGWYLEQLYHLRVDGHSEREVVLHLRMKSSD